MGHAMELTELELALLQLVAKGGQIQSQISLATNITVAEKLLCALPERHRVCPSVASRFCGQTKPRRKQ
jgi:hypothetical protein